jgi:hypothetical protein
MDLPPPLNRCRFCAASSYRRLVHRGPDGVMHYSGVYRCSGCSLEFTQVASWRERRMRPRGPSMQGSVNTSDLKASETSTPMAP